MDKKIYNENFHKDTELLTRHSAEVVCNLLSSIYKVQSVCDVGGGIGVWIDTFKKLHDFQEGIVLDGDYIDEGQLLISKDEFYPCDLEKQISIDRKFDLVICLEVAEHLRKERARSLVRDLCKLGDVILFSAAIPYQGGDGHINERPISYWRNMFYKEGYEAFDIVRPNIQNDKDICWWYKNNMIVYCNRESEICSLLDKVKTPIMLDWVRIETYLGQVNILNSKPHKFISKVYAMLNKIIDFDIRL